MTTTPVRPITLEEFLQLPETKPASEYIDGQIIQKPMPKTRHSRLQGKLITQVNGAVEDQKIAYGFPELRCTVGGRSLVPDIAVLLWERIEFDSAGEPVDDVAIAPNWVIEILSPDQSPNRVTRKILHLIQHGCRLGWLLDPGDRSVLAFQPKQEPIFCEGSDRLPMLPEIPLDLTTGTIFGWLKMTD